MLRQVAEGVLIHQSEFCQSNAVVVQSRAGVLLIDPGVHGHEMAALANDLSDSGQMEDVASVAHAAIVKGGWGAAATLRQASEGFPRAGPKRLGPGARCRLRSPAR